ncbi:MAG: hypothetical protein Q4G51_11710 [Dermatophilus congolensis]|nr:hypothetical protein [Dermatophilus congolensis]
MSIRTVHAISVVCSLSLLLLVGLFPAQAQGWSVEDGPIETLGAAWLFVASVALMWQFFAGVDRDGARAMRRNFWLPALAVLFFFIAGEEISWGQRLFGFATPDLFAGNLQGESNIHNLDLFHGVSAEGEVKEGVIAKLFVMDRLFSIFWFTWCCMLPLAWRFSGTARRVLTRLRLPIPTLTMAALFVGVYVVTKGMDAAIPALATHALVETKEAALESLLGIVGAWLWLMSPREIALRGAAIEPRVVGGTARSRIGLSG